jgi:glutamyl-tRNA reductase
MNNLTHSVHVVKTDQALPRKSSHKWQGYSFVVVSLDDLKEVDTENLENHDEMLSIWTMMDERVQKLSTVGALRNYAELMQSRHEMLVIFIVFLN